MNQSKKNQTRRLALSFLLGSIVLILFTILFLSQVSNLWKSLSVDDTSDVFAIFALFALNFVALIIFVFLFLRNIVKLIREKQALKLDSKIKTRLLLFFIATSLLPILAMASFSFLFMNRAIDRWFIDIPEKVVRTPIKVQEMAIVNQNVRLSETAKLLVQPLEGKNLSEKELQQIAQAGNLKRIEILSQDGRVLTYAQQPLNQQQEREIENILHFVHENKFHEIELTDGKGLNVGYANFSDGKKLVIVRDSYYDENTVQLVDNNLRRLDELKDNQIQIRRIGLLTLGFLTFLLIFACFWISSYIARGIIDPIKALEKGAKEIIRENFSYRIEVLAEDELGFLANTFNQMAGTLQAKSIELKERHNYIKTVLKTLSTGVISLDTTDRVITINEAAVQMFMLESTNFKDIALSKLLGTKNYVILEKVINRAKRMGQFTEQTILFCENKDRDNVEGKSLPVAITATIMPDNMGCVVVIEDLTELIKAQRAVAWQEVARRMAHEIKNPLTPIQLSAQRIAKRFALQNENMELAKIVNEGTSTIINEVLSLKHMVDEFSRFARLPNIKLENGNINELLKQTVALYHHHDIKIETSLAENLPNIMLDELQLKRVFVNLIENSIEAFDKPSVNNLININTSYNETRDFITIEFTDNGSGIAPNDFQKLFEPYFSTKNRGTGLGLAIVQQIIADHRGKISVNSNFPNGVRFKIELPANNR